MENITLHSFFIANINENYLNYLYRIDNKVPKEHANSKKDLSLELYLTLMIFFTLFR